MGLYLWGWKLFFEVGTLSYLKPYAYIWTASAFLCFFLAKIKKQFLFNGFFIGSIFGPLGVMIILLLEKDIRCFKDEEKDAGFYELLYSKMAKAIAPILNSGNYVSYFSLIKVYSSEVRYGDLDFFLDYFKLKSNIPYRKLWGDSPDALTILKEFKKMFIEFNNEYRLKFGSGFNKVQPMIEKIDGRINELGKMYEAMVKRQ
jgi:hypothetical protein